MNNEELRDQFAMAAAQGLLSGDGYGTLSEKGLAKLAYTIADEMLEARKTEKKQIPVPKMTGITE